MKFLLTLLPLESFTSISKPVPDIYDKTKKSPCDWFSIVIPIDGKTEFAATLVPDWPVKKLLVKDIDFVEVPDAKTPFVAPVLPRLVSVLLSICAV